jgi:hypothetical protein
MGAMNASRRTQPYRKGQPRHAGLAMKAMQRGRTGTGFNPADITRGLQKGANGSRTMHAPVAPAKGIAAKPAAPSGMSAEAQISRIKSNRNRAQALAKRAATAAADVKADQSTRSPKSNANFQRAKGPVATNTSSNSRAGQSYKTVATSKGEWHVYENGSRVFVKKLSARQAKARSFAQRASSPAKGVSR